MQVPTFVRPFPAQKPPPGIAQHNEESAVKLEITAAFVNAVAGMMSDLQDALAMHVTHMDWQYTYPPYTAKTRPKLLMG